MTLHTKTKTEVVKYLYDQCKYQASWRGNLKQDKESKHNGKTFM